MKNTITRSDIDALMNASEIDVCTKFGKVTVVTVKLPNGFVLVEASGAVSKENYSEEMGRKVCLDRIAQKLWSFEGYRLSCDFAKEDVIKQANDVCRSMHAIAQRDGEGTDWPAFRIQLQAALIDQHALLHPNSPL